MTHCPCAGTYGVGNNSSRTWLGPRDEWNPFDGTWECTGSHFAGGVQDCARRHSGGGHGPTDHMVEEAPTAIRHTVPESDENESVVVRPLFFPFPEAIQSPKRHELSN